MTGVTPALLTTKKTGTILFFLLQNKAQCNLFIPDHLEKKTPKCYWCLAVFHHVGKEAIFMSNRKSGVKVTPKKVTRLGC